jgi:hypothetical protein
MKPVNKDRIILACKRAIEATFDRSRWIELGYLTGTHDLITDHHRLLRSLSWGDDDYGSWIFDVLPEILGPNLERLPEVEEFVGLEVWLEKNEPQLHADLYGAAASAPVLVEEDLRNLSDASSIRAHLVRIGNAVAADPELAIGTAKELIESTAKVALRELGEEIPDSADVPELCKLVQKELSLHRTSVAPTVRGREAAFKVLGGLTAIAIGTIELRNAYGTGHGREQQVSGLGTRHAQLAVDAASTYCRMLLATLADSEAPWRAAG